MGINTSIIQVVLKSLKLFDGTVFKYKSISLISGWNIFHGLSIVCYWDIHN
jgi:hypothetical protein